MEKAIEIFGQGMPKKPKFSWVSGLRPRTTRRQASSRQASSRQATEARSNERKS